MKLRRVPIIAFPDSTLRVNKLFYINKPAAFCMQFEKGSYAGACPNYKADATLANSAAVFACSYCISTE